MDLPRIAMIIVTYNSSRYIEGLMEDLQLLDYPKEKLHVVMVDNGSTDTTPYLINEIINKADLKNVHLLALHKNVGFPAAVNIGILYALNKINPEFITIMNPDIRIINKSFLRQIITLMKKYELCAVSPMVLRLTKDNNVTDRIQWALGLLDVTGTAYTGFYGAKSKVIRKICNLTMFLPSSWISFTLAIIRGECIRKTGLLRSEFFLYYEDIEYSLRMLTNGMISYAVFIPSIAHAEGGSAKNTEVTKLIRILFVRNSLITTAEYLGLLPLLLRILSYVFLSLKDKYIIHGIVGFIKKVLKGGISISIAPRIPMSLIIRSNNLITFMLKYRSVEAAIKAYSNYGAIEYLKSLLKQR